MAENDYVPGSMDVTEQQKTYNVVMGAGGRIGTAFSLGLAMFFTGLLIGWGFFGSLIGFLGVFLFTNWVGKTFFSH